MGETTEYRATYLHTIEKQNLLCLILQKLLINLHMLALSGPEFCTSSLTLTSVYSVYKFQFYVITRKPNEK